MFSFPKEKRKRNGKPISSHRRRLEDAQKAIFNVLPIKKTQHTQPCTKRHKTKFQRADVVILLEST